MEKEKKRETIIIKICNWNVNTDKFRDISIIRS